MEATLDKHQLAGLDAKQRGFSRPVVFERVGEGYSAILRYETLLLKTEPHSTEDESLRTLVHTLQAQGYRQLRTQMSFRKGAYLGSQEPWIEYLDPETGMEQAAGGFMVKLLNWIRPRSTNG